MDVHLSKIPQAVLDNEYLILQELFTKGDDIQKLSVIQALPQLLQYDPNGTLTRIVPKIQQELPKSSCEFHIATSKIFKLLIEKQLPLNLIAAVMQGTESKDPVIATAWTETLLSVIPVLTIDQIKTQVIQVALTKAQPSSPVYCRVSACKILGACAAHPKMPSLDIKAIILPAVQSLCQDCFQDVRATMCSQLHLIAQGLGENLVKTSLLPSLVELASDDNMSVRSSAVAAAVLIIPFLNKDTRIDTIVPLIKQLCQKASGATDTTYSTFAREFGKLVDALQNDLSKEDCIWALQFYKVLGSRGQAVRINKNTAEVNQEVLCREQCAFNLPAVTLFTMKRIPDQVELWHSVFTCLANDSCYLVRKITAGCLHEVVKILGLKCIIVKNDLVKLLRDDAEEVLDMLVPHIGETLQYLCKNGVLSRQLSTPSTLEIIRALLKCHVELAKTYNWRIKTEFLQQMEYLTNCIPSDFIHQHFTPVMLNCVLEARAKPVRSQASRTLLVFLRYNNKETQRKWIEDNLITHLCYSKSCYTRRIFILTCVHAMELFSNNYFKQHFFEPLVALSDDPVSNIRLCVVALMPNLYKMLILPQDRKLQTAIDNVFSKLEMIEKDVDVKDVLRTKLKEIKNIGLSNNQDELAEQKLKEAEEDKIYKGTGIIIRVPKSSQGGSGVPSQNSLTSRRDVSNRSHPSGGRSISAPPRGTQKTSSGGPMPSDMRFLEHHFYIDAGISLSCGKIEKEKEDLCEEIRHKLDVLKPEPSLEALSEEEIKKLGTSTTNITDDVKVDLKRRNKKLSVPKRHSLVSSETLEAATNKKVLNRRSLNILVGTDGSSKIPICVKKSKSNIDVKRDDCVKTTKATKSENDVPSSHEIRGRIKTRPKSEIIKCNNYKQIASGDNQNVYHEDSIKCNVPNENSIIESATKLSSLPIPKRRSISEAKK